MLSDFRQAARILMRDRGAAVAAVLILAVAIGASTAVFSVVDGVFLTPAPYPEPDSIVHIWNGFEMSRSDVVNMSALEALRDTSQTLEAVSAYMTGAMTEAFPDGDVLTMARVSWSFFDRVLQVPPIVGRTFTAADEQAGATPVAMISHDFWASRFGSDPDVAGRRIVFEDYPPVEIVGVLPAGFREPRGLEEPAGVWTLAGSGPAIPPTQLFPALGRLRPEVGIAEARAELSVIQDAITLNSGDRMLGRLLRLGPLDELYGNRETRRAILLLFGAVLAVFLIGIANIAGAELARMPESEGALALRAALGARRGRLARLMIAKSLVVSLAGGTLGTLAAVAAHGVMVVNLPSAVPRVPDIRVDGGVLTFAVGVSVAAGLVIAILPALRASRADVRSMVQETGGAATGSRRHGVYRGALASVQTALSLVLLVVAALLLRSFWNVAAIDLGFEPEGLVVVEVTFPGTNAEAQLDAFVYDAVERLNAMENVESAAASGTLPMYSAMSLVRRSLSADGEVREMPPTLQVNNVTAGYFAAMRVPIVDGRSFTPAESRGGAPVAILSQAAARALFPDGSVIGRTVIRDSSTTTPLTVVGVVADVRPFLFVEKLPMMYMAYGEGANLPSLESLLAGAALGVSTGSDRSSFLAVRTSLSVRDIQRLVEGMHPDAAAAVETMDASLSRSRASHRFRAYVLGAFAAVAALLAAMGTYSVLAHGVRRRTPEFGVRMSFGARPSQLFRHVLWWALPPAIVGAIVGLGVSFALGTTLGAYVYEIEPTDGPTSLAAVAFLLAIVLGAAAVPALRAMRLDPARTLRYE